MTFEEFFTKKKISLPQLQSGEPALFMEFKGHYEQMGEKSFDHTKKYWFNQLRRRFPASTDVKVEKVQIENPIAEQTITESLSEPATAATGFKPRFRAAAATAPKKDEPAIPQDTPKVEAEPTPAPATGFKPRFKAAVTKPAEEKAVEEMPAQKTEPTAEDLADAEPPKPATGFKPRFKAGVTGKPTEDAKAETAVENPEGRVSETPADAPKPTVGFKPRFKAGVTSKVEETKVEPAVEKTEEPIPETATEAPKPTVGFKPRFKAGVTNKPVEETQAEATSQQVVEPIAADPTKTDAAKPTVGFTPRFKAGVTKPAVENPAEPVAEEVNEVTDEVKEKAAEKVQEPALEKPAEIETAKPAVGFKPRFKAGVTKHATEATAKDGKVEDAAPIIEALPDTAPETTIEEPSEEKPKPMGFKPRFNAAKIKPKDPEA